MEVHHHPKIPDGRFKHFKEYLAEGLMIFFAVFMGFLAENVREHITDGTKEKSYVNSLIIDLKQDSAKLADAIHGIDIITSGQDSLINLLSDSINQPDFSDRAYQLFFRYGTRLPIFNVTDRTIAQMINSGNLRLIESQSVADSVSNYYDNAKAIGTQANLDNITATDCFQYAQNLFKFQYGLKPKLKHKQLISTNGEIITKYINKLTQMRISNQYYAHADLVILNKNCINLIHFLKAEYNLK
jgi:hypothetical protein